MRRCPSDLRLEAHLLGLTGAAVDHHVDACGDCRWRVAGMRRLGRIFLRDVYPATRGRIFARAGIARWYRFRGPR